MSYSTRRGQSRARRARLAVDDTHRLPCRRYARDDVGRDQQSDWTIPGPRHKSGEEFRIPLTDAMRACLPTERGADGDRVFPMGAVEMVRLLHRCHEDKTLTVHGFRTSFSRGRRPWRRLRGSRDVLGAQDRQPVTRSYQRSDLFERRRELMQAWADHVTGKPVIDDGRSVGMLWARACQRTHASGVLKHVACPRLHCSHNVWRFSSTVSPPRLQA